MKRGSHILPVMESFYSIQGEGYHSGKPAFFVRLAGCNVKCTWCDVKESWSIYENQFVKIEEIVLGCTDSNYDNYDATAQVDDGSCSNSFTLNMYDSFGDGWNGNIWSISDNEGTEIFSYTQEDGTEGYSRTFNIAETSCYGDVNSDSIINISDVVILINAIINNAFID